MSHANSAATCRTMKYIFPELGEDLEILQQIFLHRAIEDSEGAMKRASLDQKRIDVAIWPDLRAQMKDAARRRELGLSVNMTDLSVGLGDLADRARKACPEVVAHAHTGRLQHTAASRNLPVRQGLTVKPWMRRLGRNNPETWNDAQISHTLSKISRSPVHAGKTLDEALWGNLMAREFGNWGRLMRHLKGAAQMPNCLDMDKFYYFHRWKCGNEQRNDLAPKLEKAIRSRAEPDVIDITDMILTHPDASRASRYRDDAEQAAIDVIDAIHAVIVLPSKGVIIDPETNLTMVAMKSALDALTRARVDLCKDVRSILAQQGEETRTTLRKKSLYDDNYPFNRLMEKATVKAFFLRKPFMATVCATRLWNKVKMGPELRPARINRAG